MIILVSFTNFQNDIKDMIEEIADRLSIIQPTICLNNHFIEVELQTNKSIRIIFKPAFPEYIKGIRPDYYWTNSYEVDKYFRECGTPKCLRNFTELTYLVLSECQKDEENWRLMS